MIDRFTRGSYFLAAIAACFFVIPTSAQQAAPVVVQPGAPGSPTRVLSAATRAALPPRSRKDIEFMQGMIHHHAQAVEMVALMDGRTENKDLRLLGARISQSQVDEMNFMKRWLTTRGEPVEMPMPEMKSSNDHAGHGAPAKAHEMLMPGMLTKEQMSELARSKGAEFDRLFLTGMIQHHNGALIMVKDLFDTAGSGQDAELFNFASDVDTSQRAEINIMRNMLGERNVK